jgi:hypothetical protein
MASTGHGDSETGPNGAIRHWRRTTRSVGQGTRSVASRSGCIARKFLARIVTPREKCARSADPAAAGSPIAPAPKVLRAAGEHFIRHWPDEMFRLNAPIPCSSSSHDRHSRGVAVNLRGAQRQYRRENQVEELLLSQSLRKRMPTERGALQPLRELSHAA